MCQSAPQGMQQTWGPEASTIIVIGPYWPGVIMRHNSSPFPKYKKIDERTIHNLISLYDDKDLYLLRSLDHVICGNLINPESNQESRINYLGVE